MYKGFLKGLKPICIQRLALLMGICYLMNPLQQQIKTIFHSVAHAMEVPGFVISHNSMTVNGKSHGHYEHPADVMQHDHTIIDLLDAVLTASNDSNDSERSLLTKVKIDKHITTYQSELIAHFKAKTEPNFWTLIEKQKIGYFENLKEPPQCLAS